MYYINLLLAVLDTVSGHSSAVEVVVRGGESGLEVFTLSYTRHLLATTLLPRTDPARYTAYLTAQLAGYSVCKHCRAVHRPSEGPCNHSASQQHQGQAKDRVQQQSREEELGLEHSTKERYQVQGKVQQESKKQQSQEQSTDLVQEPELVDQNKEQSEILVCAVANCGRSFRRHTPWENHMRAHREKENWIVKKRSRIRSKKNIKIRKVTSEKTQLVEPKLVKVKPQNIESQFKCKICNNSYQYQKAFSTHMKSHRTSMLTELKCDLCNKTFQSDTEADNHFLQEHGETESAILVLEAAEPRCAPCDEHFPTLAALSSHNLAVHGVEGEPCPVCGKLVRRSSMRNHVTMVHHAERMRRHQCDVCGNKVVGKYHVGQD